jgi:carbon monoxide dehydrogenase subunit G
MSRTVALALHVDVDADVADTWAAATDWAGQSEWMLGTVVRPTAQDGAGVGGGIEAFTGLRVGSLRLGFLDTMVVEKWEPPHLCHVRHTGRVVRGTGSFEVVPRDGGGSRFLWREDLELPLGAVGRLGWVLVRPAFAFGVQVSLRRFARWTEAHAPRAA